MKHIERIKQQYVQLLRRSGLIQDANIRSEANNVNSVSEKVLLAVVCAALYPNVSCPMPIIQNNNSQNTPVIFFSTFNKTLIS